MSDDSVIIFPVVSRAPAAEPDRPSRREQDILGDRPEDDTAARSAGWSVDDDLWWTRPCRPDDRGIPEDGPHDFCHFGFVCAGVVFVRTAEQALLYDQRKLTTWAGGLADEVVV